MGDHAWVCARCRSVNHALARRCYNCDQLRQQDLAPGYVSTASYNLPLPSGTRPEKPARWDAPSGTCPHCGTPLEGPKKSRLDLSAMLVGALVLLACAGLAGVVLLSSGGLLGAMSAASPPPDERGRAAVASPHPTAAPVTQTPALRPSLMPPETVPATGGNLPEFLSYSEDVVKVRALLSSQRQARIDRGNWRGAQRLVDEQRKLVQEALDWLDERPPADCYADVYAMFKGQMELSLEGLDAEEAWIADNLNGGKEQRVSNLRHELLTMTEDYNRALLQSRCW